MENLYEIRSDGGRALLWTRYDDLCVMGNTGNIPYPKENFVLEDKMKSFLKEAEENNIRFTSTRDAPMFIIASIFLDWVRETHPEFKFEAVFVGDEEARQRWFHRLSKKCPKIFPR